MRFKWRPAKEGEDYFNTGPLTWTCRNGECSNENTDGVCSECNYDNKENFFKVIEDKKARYKKKQEAEQNVGKYRQIWTYDIG